MENKDLNINEIIVIEQLPQLFYKLEKVGEYLDEEISGTYDDFEMPEEFELLDGMLTN